MKKQFLTISFMTVIAMGVKAQVNEDEGTGPRHHPRGGFKELFTEKERSCLESILGKRGEGERPTEEKLKQAFSTCQIDTSKLPPKHRDHEGSGQRPTRPKQESMDGQDNANDNGISGRQTSSANK